MIAAWPEEAFPRLRSIDPATSIAVLRQDPKLDDAELLLALRSLAGFVGTVGSGRAQTARRKRLLAAGLDDEEPARLVAPLGVHLGSIDCEEAPLSVLAEIVAARHGREGGRLKHAQGSIHEMGAEAG